MVARRVAPNNVTQTGNTYKNNIDAAFAVDARISGAFAPHQVYAGSPNPDLAVEVDAGPLWVGGALTEVGSQIVTGFTIPSAGQHRIDRVVIDVATGIASRVAGTAVTGSPTASPPAVPAGSAPICQILISSGDTVVTDSMITDERAIVPAVSASESVRGLIELATQAEVNAMTDTTRALTPNHNKLVLGTEQAATSGTSIDFTGIPAGTRRITITPVDASMDATVDWLIQLGDAGGVETSGYLGSGSTIAAATAASTNYTAGFGIRGPGSTTALHGAVTLTLEDAVQNTWVCSGVLGDSAAANTHPVGGSKSLSATLDRVRITSTSGAANWDAGAFNITCER